jgi:hypothetical protein
MTDEEKAAPGKAAALKTLRSQFIGNSAATQRELLATALQSGWAISTIEARRFLDILHPAGRALELRRDGMEIVTHWQAVVTEAGARHRVGLYVLGRGAAAGGAA